jgi:hypothetical protein
VLCNSLHSKSRPRLCDAAHPGRGPSPGSGLRPVTPGESFGASALHPHPHHGRQARPASAVSTPGAYSSGVRRRLDVGPLRDELLTTLARRFCGSGWSKGSRRRHGPARRLAPGRLCAVPDQSIVRSVGGGAIPPLRRRGSGRPCDVEATGRIGVQEELSGIRRTSATVSGTRRNRVLCPYRRRPSRRDREKRVRELGTGRRHASSRRNGSRRTG